MTIVMLNGSDRETQHLLLAVQMAAESLLSEQLDGLHSDEISEMKVDVSVIRDSSCTVPLPITFIAERDGGGSAVRARVLIIVEELPESYARGQIYKRDDLTIEVKRVAKDQAWADCVTYSSRGASSERLALPLPPDAILMNEAY